MRLIWRKSAIAGWKATNMSNKFCGNQQMANKVVTMTIVGNIYIIHNFLVIFLIEK